MEETKFFDADFRKNPKTNIFCAYCQKDLNPENIEFLAFLDFETEPTIINPRFAHKFSSIKKELQMSPIGSGCANKVGHDWLIKIEDIKPRIKEEEEKTECQFCHEVEVIYDGTDECGHINYYCKKCGEPQED